MAMEHPGRAAQIAHVISATRYHDFHGLEGGFISFEVQAIRHVVIIVNPLILI